MIPRLTCSPVPSAPVSVWGNLRVLWSAYRLSSVLPWLRWSNSCRPRSVPPAPGSPDRRLILHRILRWEKDSIINRYLPRNIDRIDKCSQRNVIEHVPCNFFNVALFAWNSLYILSNSLSGSTATITLTGRPLKENKQRVFENDAGLKNSGYYLLAKCHQISPG